MKHFLVSVGVLGLISPFALKAAETITYTYDELGRLIGSSSSGGPRDGRSASISLDPAGNRTGYASGLPLPPQVNSAVFLVSGATPVNEGGTAIFTISKTGTAFTVMTVNFASVDGSATANADYTPVNATLSFQPSETVKQISIATVADQVAEGSEQFSVVLSSPSAGGTISTASAVGTINASAGPPPPNQPPVTNADPELRVDCGAYGTLDVVSNDTDPDGDLPLSLVSLAGSGLPFASIASPTTIGFSAPQSFNTSFQLIYTIRDARGETATGVIALRATGTVAKCSIAQQVAPPSGGD